MEFIKSVKLFNEIAGTKEEFNVRKAALYTGLVLEEVAELLHSVGDYVESSILDELATAYKTGEKDDIMYTTTDRIEFLDAAVDIMVVAAGAGIAIGADVEGAADEVCRSNLSKYETDVPGEFKVLRDSNGKIQKGAKYFKPSLAKYLKD